MVVISADDHICEPPDMFDSVLSGELLAGAPKNRTDKNGNNYWTYQGHIRPLIGLNAVVGRPYEEYGMEPSSFEQLRKGCYDVHARIDDMDVNGIAASMCFGNSIGFDGQTFRLTTRPASFLRCRSGTPKAGPPIPDRPSVLETDVMGPGRLCSRGPFSAAV